MEQTTRMPVLFIGHGSPMNTLEINRFSRAWRDVGQRLPRPRAILAISAHWFIPGTAVTAMARPRVIHDFFGFPRELFAFDYPAPGAPDVAQEVTEVIRPRYVGLDTDSWGLDHGTWSVLAHLFPQADVPVVQLSIHSGEALDYHIDLGARLAALRDRGVLIVGSGNVVHNLRLVDWRRADSAFDWAEEFDREVQRVMSTHPESIGSVLQHAEYRRAVPTPDHFLPLAYLCGLCAAARQPAQPFAQGGTLGAITMTSYALGLGAAPAIAAGEGAAASLPPPEVVPPEQTNT